MKSLMDFIQESVFNKDINKKNESLVKALVDKDDKAILKSIESIVKSSGEICTIKDLELESFCTVYATMKTKETSHGAVTVREANKKEWTVAYVYDGKRQGTQSDFYIVKDIKDLLTDEWTIVFVGDYVDSVADAIAKNIEK